MTDKRPPRARVTGERVRTRGKRPWYVPPAPAQITGADVLKIRRALGWSQADMARALQVRFETIARWERGKQRLSNLAARTLQRVLMVPSVAAALSEELRRLGAESLERDADTPPG